MKADERMQRLLAIEAFVKDFRRQGVSKLKKADGLQIIETLEEAVSQCQEAIGNMVPVHRIGQTRAIVEQENLKLRVKVKKAPEESAS